MSCCRSSSSRACSRISRISSVNCSAACSRSSSRIRSNCRSARVPADKASGTLRCSSASELCCCCSRDCSSCWRVSSIWLWLFASSMRSFNSSESRSSSCCCSLKRFSCRSSRSLSSSESASSRAVCSSLSCSLRSAWRRARSFRRLMTCRISRCSLDSACCC